MTELSLHKTVAQFLALALPDDAAWTTFPAGGGGHMRGKILKGAGLKAGWPDIQVIYRGRYFGIELKARKGVLSDKQKSAHLEILDAGGAVCTARSVDEVEDFLRFNDVPLRVVRA